MLFGDTALLAATHELRRHKSRRFRSAAFRQPYTRTSKFPLQSVDSSTRHALSRRNDQARKAITVGDVYSEFRMRGYDCNLDLRDVAG